MVGESTLGALVAALNKKGENVIPSVFSMLQELIHRGKNGHGISTPDYVVAASTLEKLEIKNIDSSIALGHNLSYNLSRDTAQPIQGNGFSFIFEGRMFPTPNLPDLSETKEFLNQLGSNPIKNIKYILEKLSGSYVFAVAQPKKILVGRDVFGTTPLYYGESVKVLAVASERKALWKLGINNVKSFPPGQVAVMSKYGFSFSPVRQLRKPPKEKLNIETAAQALELLLLESVRKHLSDLETICVAFSGGVDSTVVAALAKNIGLDVHLVTVGLENQPEVLFTQKAAQKLNLPLHLQTYRVSDLEDTLYKVLWLIEEPHVVNASIAIPFYWLAETASKLGFPVLLAGQGADELFGGYQRYITVLEKSGAEIAEQKMFCDVRNAYETNFERDNKVCSYHGVELRLPFIDFPVVDFALRLPLHFKINSIEDRFRKHILRRVARNLEIPSLMADKPKKAVQYSTGVTKALQYLAKKEQITLREYIGQAFNRIFPSKNKP